METAKFIEIVGQATLPFIFCGKRLNDDKCQKILSKVQADGSILGIILEDGFGSHGLVITEKGIWFSVSKGKVNIILPKNKGVYLFDDFIIHSVSVKKTFLGNYDIEFVLWDKNKKKSLEFQFELIENYVDNDETACKELTAIFESLTSKTGTEYIDPDEEKSTDNTPVSNSTDDPNTFDFVWGNLWSNIHTIITLKDDAISISKLKFDDKTKIQTPQGKTMIISRPAIASVKKGRSFSPLSVLGGILIGVVIGFIGFGGIYTVLIFTIISLLLAFPQKFVIARKDGTKFKTRFFGNEKNNRNYDRFINMIFKQITSD